VRVVVVDDSASARGALEELLADVGGIVVLGGADSGEEALARLAELKADLVVMDWSMPGMDGVEATARIRHEFPGTRVVESAIIDSGNWREWSAAERGRPLSRAIARLMLPFYRPKKWLELARHTPYIFKHIKAYAVVLQKQPLVKANEGAAVTPDDFARVA